MRCGKNVRQTTRAPRNAIGVPRPEIWQGGRAVLAHRHPAGTLGHPGANFGAWRVKLSLPPGPRLIECVATPPSPIVEARRPLHIM